MPSFGIEIWKNKAYSLAVDIKNCGVYSYSSSYFRTSGNRFIPVQNKSPSFLTFPTGYLCLRSITDRLNYSRKASIAISTQSAKLLTESSAKSRFISSSLWLTKIFQPLLIWIALILSINFCWFSLRSWSSSKSLLK